MIHVAEVYDASTGDVVDEDFHVNIDQIHDLADDDEGFVLHIAEVYDATSGEIIDEDFHVHISTVEYGDENGSGSEEFNSDEERMIEIIEDNDWEIAEILFDYFYAFPPRDDRIDEDLIVFILDNAWRDCEELGRFAEMVVGYAIDY